MASIKGKEQRPQTEPGTNKVSVLEQALWKKLDDADSPEDLAGAWLTLQCKQITGAVRAEVVMGEPEDGSFAAAAYWPEGTAGSPGLVAVSEKAMSQRVGVVQNVSGTASQSQNNCDLAFPLLIDGKLHGVAAIEVSGQPSEAIRDIMRKLQWGATWIENVIRRQSQKSGEAISHRTAFALDLTASIQEVEMFRPACTLAVTELATRLGCDRVSVGFREKGHAVVATVSHTAQLAKRMNLIRSIGAAMDEAIDQKAPVLYPYAQEADFRISHAHAALVRDSKAGIVLTIPFTVMGLPAGAFTFEKPSGHSFDQAEIDLCDCVAATLGPMLDDRRQKERPVYRKLLDGLSAQAMGFLGTANYGRKVAAALLLAGFAFLYFTSGDYRITAPARLEGMVQRAIVAPFNGYILRQHARAGDTVRAGNVLAALDDKDLVLERLGWTSTRYQHLAERNQALAEHNRSQTNIIAAQIDQASSQIELLDEQIKRAELTAPFDGLIVSGDLSQSIGSSVQRGEMLFEIAPLDTYRIILEIDESDIAEIQTGQQGTLVVSSIPDEQHFLTIDKVTPITEARDGRNFFQIEASLHETSIRLRPGMEGIGKIDIAERRLIWIWTHKIVEWMRLQLWEYWP